MVETGKIEIVVGKELYDSKVILDGVDLSRYVEVCDLTISAGEPARVWLTLMPTEVKLPAEIEAVIGVYVADAAKCK